MKCVRCIVLSLFVVLTWSEARGSGEWQLEQVLDSLAANVEKEEDGLVLKEKADALRLSGQIDSSTYYYALAAPKLKAAGEWDKYAWSLALIGYNAYSLNQPQVCLQHLDHFETVLAEIPITEADDRNIMLSTIYGWRGAAYESLGDIDRAIESTRASTEYESATSEPYLDAIRTNYQNLGTYFLQKGDFQRAFDHFIQAETYLSPGDKPTVLFNNLGELLSRQKKYDLAIDYFKRSLAFSEGKVRLVKDQVNSLNGLGVAYREIKDYPASLAYCQQALSLPTDYQQFIAWTTIGNTFIRTGDAASAIYHLNEAKKAYLKDPSTANSSFFFISRIHRLLGDAHYLQEDFPAAIAAYQQAIIVNHGSFSDRSGSTNPPLVDVFSPIYLLDALEGKAKTQAALAQNLTEIDAALATYQLTADWIDSLQVSYSSETAQLAWSSRFKGIYEQAIRTAYRAYQLAPTSAYLQLALTFSEKSKNAVLLERLRASEGKSVAGVADSLLRVEKDLNLDLAYYEKARREALQGDQTERVKLFDQYMAATRLSLATLQDQLEEEYSQYQSLKYGEKILSIPEIINLLPDDRAAFVEYFIGEDAAFVFGIQVDKGVFKSLPPTVAVRQRVADFRSALLAPDLFTTHATQSIASYQESALAVYGTLVSPVLSELPGGVNQLIFSLDDALHLIPFGTLIKNENNQASTFAELPYLIKQYRIAYAYSAGLLAKNQQTEKQLGRNTNCLAMAPPYPASEASNSNATADHLRRGDVAPLVGATVEVDRIADHFSGTFTTDHTADERRFKATAEKYGIIHLAMHGMADTLDANLNCLKFSNIRTDSVEDNLLYHYEIANLELAAQLVVLSACETGVGVYKAGEGVFSLARSFMYAGVPSVVMSLWPVSDGSTSEIMPNFYRALKAGQPKDEALRTAKLEFLRTTNLEKQHPYYWSAFVTLGDTSAIKQGWKLTTYQLIALLLLGIAILLFGYLRYFR